jgi:uncharacterized membrane protein
MDDPTSPHTGGGHPAGPELGAGFVGERRGVPVAPGFVLGVGLGGLVDGIVLHQILQWHHMLTAMDRYPSTTIAGLEANTVADGLFHAAAWVLVFVGSWLTLGAWQEGRLAPPWRTYVGLLLIGWGVFNFVEGVVDHHVLRVHHVRDDVTSPLPWDLGFLALGVAVLAVGLVLVRSGRRGALGQWRRRS